MLFFPKLGKLFPKLTGYDFVMEAVLKYRNIAVEHIERHLKEINYEVSPRDFIDVYLQEIKATTDPTSSFYKDAGSTQNVEFKNCSFWRNSLIMNLTLQCVL